MNDTFQIPVIETRTNEAFQALVIQARTGDITGAAQTYADMSGKSLEETLKTMKGIQKIFAHVSTKVRDANQEEQLGPEQESN